MRKEKEELRQNELVTAVLMRSRRKKEREREKKGKCFSPMENAGTFTNDPYGINRGIYNDKPPRHQ
jgi:hypothetical protein